MTIPCSCCPIADNPTRCWNDGFGGSGTAVSLLCCVPIVGATYEVDWTYAHRERAGSGVQTAQLRIGDATAPLGTNPVVDVHIATPAWVVRAGTLAIGAGFPQLRFEFNALGGAPGAGNFLDSTSVILRRVLPTPANFGEQLTNGGFELPVFGANSVNFPSAVSTGWQTTDTCNCLEYWHNTFGGVPAHTGVQHVEMNAFQAGTLSQVATLETCQNQVTWFDVATGDVVSSGLLVPCP